MRRQQLAGIVALVALVALASASDVRAQPAWWAADENDPIPPPSRWTAEVKVGPYLPEIDKQFDGATGPFEYVYGDDRTPLVVAEIDRYFLWPEGQLGVLLSVGYTYKTADGFELDDAGAVELDGDGSPIRYSGYRTVFRLYPISAGVVYRFTALDDRYRIPFVPYAKVGLAYYVWRFMRPKGEVEDVAEDPMCTETRCLDDRGLGTTMGWQATVGLSFRGDRLDKNAGMNLAREFGIDHAGLFVEGTLARVDGFGGSEDLRVGDVTWFAGINFEF